MRSYLHYRSGEIHINCSNQRFPSQEHFVRISSNRPDSINNLRNQLQSELQDTLIELENKRKRKRSISHPRNPLLNTFDERNRYRFETATCNYQNDTLLNTPNFPTKIQLIQPLKNFNYINGIEDHELNNNVEGKVKDKPQLGLIELPEVSEPPTERQLIKTLSNPSSKTMNESPHIEKMQQDISDESSSKNSDCMQKSNNSFQEMNHEPLISPEDIGSILIESDTSTQLLKQVLSLKKLHSETFLEGAQPASPISKEGNRSNPLTFDNLGYQAIERSKDNSSVNEEKENSLNRGNFNKFNSSQEHFECCIPDIQGFEHNNQKPITLEEENDYSNKNEKNTFKRHHLPTLGKSLVTISKYSEEPIFCQSKDIDDDFTSKCNSESGHLQSDIILSKHTSSLFPPKSPKMASFNCEPHKCPPLKTKSFMSEPLSPPISKSRLPFMKLKTSPRSFSYQTSNSDEETKPQPNKAKRSHQNQIKQILQFLKERSLLYLENFKALIQSALPNKKQQILRYQKLTLNNGPRTPRSINKFDEISKADLEEMLRVYERQNLFNLLLLMVLILCLAFLIFKL